MLSVREVSMVPNCWILVCTRLARLKRMAGMVWDFLSVENSLEAHASWTLHEPGAEQTGVNHNTGTPKPTE